MRIPFTVDTHIRVDKFLLSNDIKQDLQEYLYIEPPSYGEDHIIFTFYEEDDTDIILPRGFLSRFEDGLRKSGHTPECTTNYADAPVQRSCEAITLRPHQEHPVESITSGQDFTGIYVAPPGSGKTATALECIRRAGQRTIVLVDRASVADQWIERAEQFLGITPTKIGEGEFEVSDFTVATKQTLWSKLKTSKIDSDWFSQWGFVVVDECHAIQAATYQQVVQKFRPRYLLGLSATPHKVRGMSQAVEFMVGRISVETHSEGLVQSNVILKPSIEVVQTNLEVEYKAWIHRGIQRNNYQSLLKRLVEDQDRNNLIAQKICDASNTKRLLVTKRLKHISLIESAVSELDSEIELLRLTGKESPQERKDLISSLDNLDNFLLLSTVADEAIDIPSLDALFNVFPVRNTDLLKQILGRVERNDEGKKTPVVYDFHDIRSNIFNNQFSDRLYFYKSRDLDINFALVNNC